MNYFLFNLSLFSPAVKLVFYICIFIEVAFILFLIFENVLILKMKMIFILLPLIFLIYELHFLCFGTPSMQCFSQDLYKNEIERGDRFNSERIFVLEDGKFASMDNLIKGNDSFFELDNGKIVKYSGEKFILLKGQIPKDFMLSERKIGRKEDVIKGRYLNSKKNEIEVLAELQKLVNNGKYLYTYEKLFLIKDEVELKLIDEYILKNVYFKIE